MINCTRHIVKVLSMIGLLALVSGCSIFISTPRTAKIHIQGADNHHYDYVIPLDTPCNETNLDIKITKNYAVQLDFDWLWDATIDMAPERLTDSEDMIPPLVPWMLCKYRF